MNLIEKLNGKKIALMGGAGFIGHNLALKLNELGAEVNVIDGLQVNSLGYYNSDYDKNPRAELYIGFINERLRLLREAGVGVNVIDIRDYHVVCHMINSIKPDVVIHLAAIAHANRSNKDPFSTFDHSLRTLENVLDSTRDQGIHFIYLSSSMVYGDFDGKAATEDQVCNPIGIYGALKFGAEKLLIGYHQVFKTPYTIIRPSALYGERCVSRRVGQAFIESALTGQDLAVNGDGSDSLDFTYIQDLIQGILRVIVTPEAQGEVFNLTYGEARKLIQLAELVQEYFPDVHLKHNPSDKFMPERGTLSIEKAKRILGYQPQFPLEKGYVNYINWYKEFSSMQQHLFQNDF